MLANNRLGPDVETAQAKSINVEIENITKTAHALFDSVSMLENNLTAILMPAIPEKMWRVKVFLPH